MLFLFRAHLPEVVEAVDDGCLGGRQLGQHVEQLHHHLLVLVDDGQVERPVRSRGEEGGA